MIKETLFLPSQGIPYRGKLEGSSIKIKPLTTRAYKDYLVVGGEEGILNLVDSCLADSPIKAEDLVFQDELAIYLKIRAMSIGAEFPVFSTCPYCNTQNKEKWNILNIPCTYLSMDTYPYKAILPETQISVEFILPSSKLNRFAREEAKKRAGIFNKKVEDFLPTFQTVILLNVQGISDMIEKADWYENLPIRDAVFIDNVLEKMQSFGVELSRIATCISCNKEYPSPLKVDSTFFRPDLGDIDGVKTAKGTLEKGPSGTAPSE